SIQNAFDAANGGDNIRIWTGSGAYAGASTPSGRSGTSASPIIVEPDTGANPNITGEIDIVDASYWTIRNLRFDACSTETTASHAIAAWAQSHDTTGIVISGNTINCWGGTNQSYGGGGRDQISTIILVGSVTPEYWVTGTISGNTVSQGIRY